MLDHEIMLTRAQAIVDGDAETIVLCDLAFGRTPNPMDQRKLARSDRDRLRALTRADARAELDRAAHPSPPAAPRAGTPSSRWYTPDAAGDCLVCWRGEGEHARGAWGAACPPEDVARARCEADRNADAAATSLESCRAGREADRLEALATVEALRLEIEQLRDRLIEEQQRCAGLAGDAADRVRLALGDELADLRQRLIGMTRVASLATRDANAALAREGITNAKYRAAVMRTIPRDASWVLPDRIVEESAIILDQAIEPWRDPSPLASPDCIQAAIVRATESITGRPYAVVTSDLEDPPGCRRDDCWIYTTCQDPDHCPAMPKPATPAAVAIASASVEAMPAEEIAFAVASVRAGVRRSSAPLVALAALADLVEQWIAATKDLQVARAGLRPGQVTTASEEAATRVDELERALKRAVRRG